LSERLPIEVLNIEEYIIDVQEHLHRHPEMSLMETETMAFIKKELDSMGIPHNYVEGGGILGHIEGERPGKTLLLRADIDALQMDENTSNNTRKKVCVSLDPGLCHGCGHDGHVAMLLGAAKILSRRRDFAGRVILLFEQAEEIFSGVYKVCDYLQLTRTHIDSVFSMHLYAGIPSGQFSVCPGPVMSGSTTFDRSIIGASGHGSRPDQANSPVDCFAAAYAGLSVLKTRLISPFRPFSFSVGHISAGATHNVIPDELRFSGTIRYFDTADGESFLAAMDKLLENTAEAYGCKTRHNVKSLIRPVLINDPSAAALAAECWNSFMPEGSLINAEPWMASETMAVIHSHWPGAMGFLGINNPSKGTGAPHHNGHFEIDQDVLKYGTAMHVAYARNFLKG